MSHLWVSGLLAECRVAIDRGLRLAEKRCLPCPNRTKWLDTRDRLYETIQEKGFNKEKGAFIQSYEDRETLDSAVRESSPGTKAEST